MSFRSAATLPVLCARVAARLDEIFRAHACFSDRHHPSRRKQHKRGPKSRYHRGQAGPSLSGRLSRSAPVLLNSGTESERKIRSDLNKLADSNYASISMRLKFVADADNLSFTFRTALEKAYLEPEHNSLYVNLFRDLLGAAAGDAREAALDIFRSEIPTEAVIASEALRPPTDPVADYDAFCESCRLKRRMVGRSATFASLLGFDHLAASLQTTPLDVYSSHERVLVGIVGGTGYDGAGMDVSGAVEIVLDSLGTVVGRHRGILPRFREVVDEIGMGSFPSARCRFKVMDIIKA